MQRLENLISMARKLSGNTRYDATSGVPQDVFVQHFNDAQDSLAKQVVNLKTKFFKKTITVDVVPGQAIYPWPSDCYIQSLETLQWSNPGKGVYYQTITKTTTKEKVTSNVGYPYAYIPCNEGIELNPPINSGVLYLTYEFTLPKLQKRSGRITTATMAGSDLTALAVDQTESIYDETEINSDYFLCVVDKYGNIKARDIEYDSVSAGVFTLSPFAIPSDESVSVGDYILAGKNTCNIPEWPDICESFLRKYAVYQARYGDSSKWTAEAKNDMIAEFELLSTSFALLSEDITDIPITNYELIGY